MRGGRAREADGSGETGTRGTGKIAGVRDRKDADRRQAMSRGRRGIGDEKGGLDKRWMGFQRASVHRCATVGASDEQVECSNGHGGSHMGTRRVNGAVLRPRTVPIRHADRLL